MYDFQNIALLGQPNVGKTTIFNVLTGSSQKIGNWPGVTVEKREGEFTYENVHFMVTDLPGIYSLNSDSIDQKISRDFIIKSAETKNNVILNIVDTSNINRNLYLTLQLMELGISPVICLNLIDEAEKSGMKIDIKKLSEKLQSVVLKTSGRYNIGIDELKKAVYDYSPEKQEIKYSKLLEDSAKVLENNINASLIPKKYEKISRRGIAIALLEGDPEFLSTFDEDIVNLRNNIKEKVENEIKHDIESYVVEQRYKKIDDILSEVTKGCEFYDDVDSIVTHPAYGFLVFLAVFYLMFKFVYGLGDVFTGIIAGIFEVILESLSLIIPSAYQGILIDGLFSGVGAVLEFFPLVFLMILSLSVLEDTGYLSRVTALMHGIMSKFGLNGKSTIPLLTCLGCTVPGIMGSRFISNHKERLITMLVAPLVPCSARFVIIGFLAAVFFPQNATLFTISIIGITILLMMLVSYILGKLIKGKSDDLIFELPPYRVPDWKNVFKMTWQKGKEFLKKAGTVIALGSVLFYALTTYPTPDYNYAMSIGTIIEPLTMLMGLDGTAGLSLLFGIFAKELVVSVLEISYSGNILEYLTPLNAFVLALVSTIYIPCVSAIAALYLETRSLKWTGFGLAYNLGLATIVGIIVHTMGRFFGF
ncbi:ferrous iron transport protein B [Methanococcus maripaludis]|uniref:Ferrous iron transport protein B n=2 Tax=Methanococcus maripaludis TaxID=39152 RepID=A0A7J9PIS8_METMI|nr:ferrous iron transport protein B [Methanococcus maripaludis]MBA2862694.1 ferrous iron transport protein B [Methanococcus maripaludis]